MRVLPGRLSVTRTFGDFEAKLSENGSRCIIPIPEIKSFEVTDEHDFIVMGCDGIFDRMNNSDAVKCIWKSTVENKQKEVHEQAAVGVEWLIKNSLLRKTLDNVTVVVVAFSGFKRRVWGRAEPVVKRETQSLSPGAENRVDDLPES